MRAKGYLRDTAVVIIGDHLAMPNPVYDKLLQANPRRIFNLVVTEWPLKLEQHHLLPFDFYPTLLELAGFDVAGDRLGLGFSALGEASRAPSTVPSLNGSAAYRKLWKPLLAAQ